jgi:hypothetical protein
MSYKRISPTPEVEGGTNLQTYSTGDLLYASGANTLTKLAAGTDTHVLTLASGVPSWAAPASGGGGWAFISSATASASATLDFTSGIDSTYAVYAFVFSNLVPATNSVDFYLRTSTDGGSTYDSGASDYGWKSDSGNVSNDTEIKISATNTVTNTAASAISGSLFLYQPSVTYVTSTYSIGYLSGSSYERSDGTGRRHAAADVDAVRFYFSSGNITSGTIYMYGAGTPS